MSCVTHEEGDDSVDSPGALLPGFDFAPGYGVPRIIDCIVQRCYYPHGARHCQGWIDTGKASDEHFAIRRPCT